MPRVPYKPNDLSEPKDLVDSIRARRGGNLLNLDRILLHSPPFAKGWNTLLREVRTTLSLSPKLRELAICAVAMINGAEYEFHHHAPEFLKEGGTEAQLEALRRLQGSTINTAVINTAVFDATERAVLQLTAEMTRNVQVADGTFSAVKTALEFDRQVIELVGVISAYNMVSRFLIATKIEPEE